MPRGCCHHLAHLLLEIVAGPAGSGNVLRCAGPAHDRPAVGVVARARVALDRDHRAVGVYPLHDPHVLGLAASAAEIKHDDVPGLIVARDPLARLLVPAGQHGAAGRPIEVETGLPEDPPDKDHAPGDAVDAVRLAVFLPVGSARALQHADLPCGDLEYRLSSLRLERGHLPPSETFWVPK